MWPAWLEGNSRGRRKTIVRATTWPRQSSPNRAKAPEASVGVDHSPAISVCPYDGGSGHREEDMNSGMKKTLLAAAMAVLAGGSAIAADTFIIKAKVPFDFMVGNQRVEAGEYLIAHDAARNSVRITARETGVALLALRHPAGDNATGQPYALVFNKYGERHFLREIWGGPGVAGAQLPASRSEKEAMARRVPEKTTLTASAAR
jgi:hypothetical protein